MTCVTDLWVQLHKGNFIDRGHIRFYDEEQTL